jgi:hypothetical protein
MIERELVVPWSIANTYFAIEFFLLFHDKNTELADENKNSENARIPPSVFIIIYDKPHRYQVTNKYNIAHSKRISSD